MSDSIPPQPVDLSERVSVHAPGEGEKHRAIQMLDESGPENTEAGNH
jgi:hypothetical protein